MYVCNVYNYKLYIYKLYYITVYDSYVYKLVKGVIDKNYNDCDVKYITKYTNLVNH